MTDFIKYLEAKDLSKTTQNAYLRCVNLFIIWYKQEPESCTKKDILKYLEHLQNNCNQQNVTRKNALIAIHHYFTFLAKTAVITTIPTSLIKIRGTHKKTLYNIYTPEELNNFYDNYYHSFIRNYDDRKLKEHSKPTALLSRQRNYIMLGMLLYQGLSTNELQNISVNDIDLNKATVKIEGGKKSNARTIPLHVAQIGSLINYTNVIRPQFFNFCNDNEQLFFPLPEGSKAKTNNTNLMGTLKTLTVQVRSLDRNFLNFKQIRASVITQWLKTEGLRKTQYLAGHRYISSTESYLPNDIDVLIDDVTKFNPF